MRKVIMNLVAVLAAVIAAASITAPANAGVGSEPSPLVAPPGAARMTGDGVGVQAWDERFQNFATARILDDSFQYGLRAIPENYGNLHQLWALTAVTTDRVEIKNHATGRCLDDSFEYGLRPYGCNGQPFQRWTIWYWPDDPSKGWVLQNEATGRAVDDSFEYGLRAYGINYLAWQQW
ncbi:RICIN domain-containing protein [Plantactinospora soyae]|uniref:Ricin B lectin domain-containing protein n=1 Tax=Plantactinospora soyae TaxID=1544732 RepID=A0A927M9S4_9ACTN|nr:RICIN domain-containing protein [Plantactinospora soyae]MBE1487105.1 hypothetical protein [Plantactinospora soyae]